MNTDSQNEGHGSPIAPDVLFQPHWVDHLQNAIDLACPTLTTAQSRRLAECWDNIFIEAEAQANNCDSCSPEEVTP